MTADLLSNFDPADVNGGVAWREGLVRSNRYAFAAHRHGRSAQLGHR